MPKFSPRRLSRRLSTSLTFLFLFAIASAVVGEFFIEFGKERGWYDKPSQRLEVAVTTFEVAVTTLSAFVTQTWFLVLAALLTGVSIGLWLDIALRKREAISALPRSTSSELLQNAEPGMLDYIVEGLQSIQDIARIFSALTKPAENIAATMERHQRRFFATNDPQKRLKLAAKLSLKLNEFSQQMKAYIPQISDATKRIQVNCLPVIEETPILNLSDLNSLLEFAGTLKMNFESSSGTAQAVSGTKNAVQNIVGISRDLNVSAQVISDTAEALHVEIIKYAQVCEGLFLAATNRAEAVLKVLSNPDEPPSTPPPPDTVEKKPQ